MAQEYKATLIAKEETTPLIFSFIFELSQELSFVPGQYIFLSKEGDDDLKRPFSIFDYENKKLTLGIKKHGKFTNILWESKINDQFIVLGPFGRFYSEAKKTIFIAGGIGITPIYNMLINRDSNTENYLFYSSRSEKESPFLSKIEKLKNVKTKIFFTREESNKGEYGRIKPENIFEKIKNVNNYEFLICGPGKMIEEIREALIKSGVKDEQIKSEEF